jgi:outer membrane beta-barrel protein
MRVYSAALLALVFLVAPGASFGAEEDEGEEQGLQTLAVQNRLNTQTHEFSAWIGTLPLDAFKKGLTFSGAYSLHFTDLVGWEVGQFTYSHGIETDLNAELENLQVGPTPFQVVRYYVTSNLMLKPVYQKMALLNQTLLYGELFIVVGGGYGWMTIESRPIVDVGVGMRIYAGSILSVRIDIRDLMFITTDDLHNELWIALGICLGFD